MKYLLIFVIILGFAACKSRQPSSGKPETGTEKTEKREVKEDREEEVSETFSSFLERFSSDSLFQMQRVRFPFTVLLLSDEEEGLKKKVLSKSEWQLLDLRYKEEYSKSEMDAFTQRTVLQATNATIEIRGVDNGIHIDYEFRLIDGRWFLTKEKDFST